MGSMFSSGWSGGSWDSLPDYMQQMMQSYWGGMRPFVAYTWLAHLITWILIVALLVAAIRYLWIKGGK